MRDETSNDLAGRMFGALGRGDPVREDAILCKMFRFVRTRTGAGGRFRVPERPVAEVLEATNRSRCGREGFRFVRTRTDAGMPVAEPFDKLRNQLSKPPIEAGAGTRTGAE